MALKLEAHLVTCENKTRIQVGLVVKNVSVMRETACTAGGLGSIPGLGRSPGEGNGNPLQYSSLRNQMDRGAWLDIVHGVAKSRTQLRESKYMTKYLQTWDLSSTNLCSLRKRQPMRWACTGPGSLLKLDKVRWQRLEVGKAEVAGICWAQHLRLGSHVKKVPEKRRVPSCCLLTLCEPQEAG